MSENVERPRQSALGAARQVLEDLRALGKITAPDSVAEGALHTIGLADGYTAIQTPLGTVYVAWNTTGISAVTHAPSEEAFRVEARARLGRPVVPAEPPARMKQAIAAWLAGDDHAPLNFDLSELTSFEQAVLLKAREIPRGEVRPYGWIAREIGRPGATRAVGTALARNPIPLFIPCHRVVRTDGHIGNYSMGGRDAKRLLLTTEGVDVDTLEQLAASGGRYLGSETTHIYCYPTCGHAKRITLTHRVIFRDESHAHNAGYRPCHVCRPPEARKAS